MTVVALPKDASGKSKYFEGTPIPTSLAIVAMMAVWVGNGWVGEGNLPGGVLGKGGLAEVHPVVGVFVGWGCMMVSKSIHIPKP